MRGKEKDRKERVCIGLVKLEAQRGKRARGAGLFELLLRDPFTLFQHIHRVGKYL